MFMTAATALPQDDAAQYRAILNEMIALGAELARMIVRRAREAEAGAPSPDQPRHRMADPSAAFDRVARTIRRCIALATSLTGAATHRGRGAEADRPERPDRSAGADLPGQIGNLARDLGLPGGPPSVAQLRAEIDALRTQTAQPKFRALRHPRAR
jgi:hypothetical protein